jgi:hypothetical protein
MPIQMGMVADLMGGEKAALPFCQAENRQRLPISCLLKMQRCLFHGYTNGHLYQVDRHTNSQRLPIFMAMPGHGEKYTQLSKVTWVTLNFDYDPTIHCAYLTLLEGM